MHSVTLLALLVATVASVAMAADKTMAVDQISVMIKEKSGGMTMTATEVKKDDDENKDDSKETDDDKDDGTTAEPESDTETTTTKAPEQRKRRATDDPKTNTVEVMFVSLKEVNDKGEVVGATKANSQALDSFDEVTFTFNDDSASNKIPYSVNKDNNEIMALVQSYETNLQGSGMAKIVVYIAKEDGNLTLGDDGSKEMTEVKKGQIKFSVHIDGWVWCTTAAGNCMKGEGDAAEKEVGNALDMMVKVKGHGEASKMDTAAGMALHYSIGADNHLFISKKVRTTKTDGTNEWKDMAADPTYAKVDDNTSSFTMRFPMFEKAMLYDPCVRLMVPGSDQTSASNAIVASVGVVLAALVAAVLRL